MRALISTHMQYLYSNAPSQYFSEYTNLRGISSTDSPTISPVLSKDETARQFKFKIKSQTFAIRSNKGLVFSGIESSHRFKSTAFSDTLTSNTPNFTHSTLKGIDDGLRCIKCHLLQKAKMRCWVQQIQSCNARESHRVPLLAR